MAATTVVGPPAVRNYAICWPISLDNRSDPGRALFKLIQLTKLPIILTLTAFQKTCATKQTRKPS